MRADISCGREDPAPTTFGRPQGSPLRTEYFIDPDIHRDDKQGNVCQFIINQLNEEVEWIGFVEETTK